MSIDFNIISSIKPTEERINYRIGNGDPYRLANKPHAKQNQNIFNQYEKKMNIKKRLQQKYENKQIQYLIEQNKKDKLPKKKLKLRLQKKLELMNK